MSISDLTRLPMFFKPFPSDRDVLTQRVRCHFRLVRRGPLLIIHAATRADPTVLYLTRTYALDRLPRGGLSLQSLRRERFLLKTELVRELLGNRELLLRAERMDLEPSPRGIPPYLVNLRDRRTRLNQQENPPAPGPLRIV